MFAHMARERAFPRPLFAIHAVLVAWHAASLFVDVARWPHLQAALNRVFEFELLYVAACAVYRIAARRRATRRQALPHGLARPD